MPNNITTFSKVKFNPLNAKKEDIFIDDIAHALSLMTRANGHFPEFYSVAQHSIYCCEEAIARGYSNKVALACLLHDGSEAYMADIIRPIKRNLDMYLKIEDSLQSVIYNAFLGESLNGEEEALVKLIDDTMLYHEFVHYMNEELPVNKSDLISKPEFRFINFNDVEKRFKDLFNKLI